LEIIERLNRERGLQIVVAEDWLDTGVVEFFDEEEWTGGRSGSRAAASVFRYDDRHAMEGRMRSTPKFSITVATVLALGGAFALVVGLVACSGIPKLVTAYPTPPVTILEKSEAGPLRGVCSRPGWPLGLLYVPHHAEVRQAESQLQNRGLTEFSCAPASPEDSLRQYLGVNTALGRVLYVNAIPGEPGTDSSPWRREATTDCEGGAAYWGALFDLDEGRFTRVDYNGDSKSSGGSCEPEPDVRREPRAASSTAADSR